MALCAGCDETVDDGGATSESTVCVTVGTASWWNQTLADMTGRFHIEFDATPSGTIDGTIGLSAGTATKWASLAAIVRFNAQGFIDARASDTYKADTSFAYHAGATYHIRFDVDVKAHTYSTWVAATGQVGAWNYQLIGRDYPFRTEQAGVTHLNNFAGYVNPQTASGTVTICNWGLVGDSQTADGCFINTAGSGFVNQNVLPSSTVLLVSLHAKPSQANIDGVVGVTVNGATTYNDLAAAIRFYTNGVLEARDGDTYRADTVVPYAAGDDFDIHFVIDLPSHTYSVYVESERDYLNRVTLARNYRFRPQQVTATSLGTVSTIVASASGRLDVCNASGGQNYNLVSARGGTWTVEPQADGGAWMSDGATTVRVNANNVPVASASVGGKVAADSAGNIYIASIANGTLTVRSYTSTFGARWTATRAVSDSAIGDIIVTTRGQVALSTGASQGNNFSPRQVIRYDSYGRYLSTTNMFAGAAAIGMSPAYYAVAVPISGGVEVEVWGYETNQLLRTRQFIGHIDITRVAAASDGSVVIGGHLTGPTTETTASTFDGCSIHSYSNTEVYWTAYATALRPDLGVRWCKALTSETEGISTDGSRIAVSYLTWTQLHYVDLFVADTTGNITQWSQEDAFVTPTGANGSDGGSLGFPGSIELGAAGQLYLNESATWGGPADGTVPLLVTLKNLPPPPGPDPGGG